VKEQLLEIVSHGDRFYTLKSERSLYEHIDKCQQTIIVGITDEVSTIEGTRIVPILEVD
jgi:hypothetical protein